MPLLAPCPRSTVRVRASFFGPSPSSVVVVVGSIIIIIYPHSLCIGTTPDRSGRKGVGRWRGSAERTSANEASIQCDRTLLEDRVWRRVRPSRADGSPVSPCMLKVVSRGTETLTHPVQFVVEPARVAHRLPRAIPPPQSGGGRVTIGTLRPLSPLGVLKAEKAETQYSQERD